MTPDVAFRRRMILADQIRAELAGLFDTPAERARWLQALSQQVIRDGQRASGPVERFPLASDSPEAAFLP